MANGKNTDPKSLKEVENLLKKINKQYSILGKKSPFKNEEAAAYLEKVGGYDEALGRLDVALEGVEGRVEKMNSTFGDLSKTLEEIVKEIDPKAFNATKGLKSAMGGLIKEANKLKFEEEGINTLSKKELETIIEKTKKSQSLVKYNAEKILGTKTEVEYNEKLGRYIDARTGKMVAMNEQEIAALGILKDQGGFQQDIIDAAEKRLEIEDKYSKTLGYLPQAAAGLDKALQKAGIPSMGIADAVEKTRQEFVKANKEGEDGAKNFSVLGSLAKNLGKNLKEAFSFANLMQMAVVAFVKAIRDVDKHTGEMAKNFGVSYESALGLREEASQVASYSDDILVNSTGILEAQTKLNKHFGSAVKFSSEMAANFDSIQKRTKLSDKAMGIFSQFALKSNKTIKDILKDTHKVVLEQNQQHKLGIGVKEVQEGIAKTSKSLQLTYKFNTKELANSVIEAKKLGVNLSEVEAIAGHLLDFESSIQSELEAELLLGKDINLEKARQFALEGKMGKVAEEVLKNKAIMHAFDTKNVIAQEAAAKALGMNREQLASMVMEQKELELLQNKLGHGIENMSDAQKEYNRLRSEGMSEEEAAKKLGDESLAQQLESVSMAEKMEGATKKVQELFIGLATDVLPLIMMALKPITATIQFMAEGIRWFIDGLKEANPAAIAIGATLATLAIPAVITAISSIFGAFAMLGPLGVPLAAVAVMGLMSKLSEGESKVKSMKDGAIDPKGGMIVRGPKGSIQLDKDDSIIAGTDLSGGNPTPGSNKMVQEQLQETKTQNQLLSQLIGNTNKLKDLDSVSFYEIQ